MDNAGRNVPEPGPLRRPPVPCAPRRWRRCGLALDGLGAVRLNELVRRQDRSSVGQRRVRPLRLTPLIPVTFSRRTRMSSRIAKTGSS